MKKFIVLYFILNILSTYLLTSSILNPSIVPFKQSILDYITAAVGNVVFLLLILSLGMCFIRRKRALVIYLIVVTFLLNMFIFLLGYFTANFKTMLSFHNLTLFRNPNAGFAYQVVIDGLSMMLNSIQILLLFPSLVLLVMFLIFKKQLDGRLNIRLNTNLIFVLLSLFSTYSIFVIFKYKLNDNWPYRAEIPQYGVGVCGVYNYYFSELVIGYNYNENYGDDYTDLNIETYDKNDVQNVNIIDGKTYINSDSDILKDMNLFVIQAEALSDFVISFEYNGQLLMPYMNALINQENVYYFSNMHTVVGLGNTSDAEFAFNTGYYPLGDLTINWEVYDNLFNIQSLPKMFSSNYIKLSYNPTIEDFYAHKYVHENFYGYDKFSGFETFNSKYFYYDFYEYYLHEKWVSDESILNLALSDSFDALNNGKNFFIFAQTISPHYPFFDVSSRYNRPFKTMEFSNISQKFSNYLNQINYIDMVLYDFLIKAKDELPNTVFLIYGDHGNSLSKKEFEALYSRKIADIEYQELLLNVPVIVYDPSGLIDMYLENKGIDVNQMLNRTLSQIDLFSTVKWLYGLECENTFGVNMFSNEPSFAVNPKSMDMVTDGFYYVLKNGNYELKGMNYSEMINAVEKIKKFKLQSDVVLTKKMKENQKC